MAVVPDASTVQSPNGTFDSTLISLSTLSLLEVRLARLEFLLTGKSLPSTLPNNTSPPPKDTTPIPERLRALESRLTQLKRLDGLPGNVVRMVDSLRREYPEIFTSQPRPVESSTPVPIHELSNRANQVLANSTVYTSTSAHLQTLQTLKIPDAEHSAKLLDANERLQELKLRQERLDAEIEELRSRSARTVEWWMKNGVVGMGELWEDWEHRVKVCERSVRRAERKQREEQGEIG